MMAALIWVYLVWVLCWVPSFLILHLLQLWSLPLHALLPLWLLKHAWFMACLIASASQLFYWFYVLFKNACFVFLLFYFWNHVMLYVLAKKILVGIFGCFFIVWFMILIYTWNTTLYIHSTNIWACLSKVSAMLIGCWCDVYNWLNIHCVTHTCIWTYGLSSPHITCFRANLLLPMFSGLASVCHRCRNVCCYINGIYDVCRAAISHLCSLHDLSFIASQWCTGLVLVCRRCSCLLVCIK